MMKISFGLICLILAGCAGGPTGSAHYCELGWNMMPEDNSARRAKAYSVCTRQVNGANVYRKGSTETQWLARAN